MNSNTLNDFQNAIYGCFGKAKDALFNLVDALASETGARSFPELSLSPLFERTWANLYEALEDGQIDAERLREVCVQFALLPENLHWRNARWVELSLIQVICHGASGSERDPRISWFVWKGNQSAPLAQIRPIYRLRYSHEHGYRFDKQELLWDAPRFSTPERTECWTQLVEGCYRQWENRRSGRTLTQVRRAMPSLLCQLGTPARPPKPRGKAPGRARGFHPRRRTRYPVIRRTSNKQKKRKKGVSV